MMLVKPASSDRQSRRHSSSTNSLSSSSVNTVKRTESLRSASATRSHASNLPTMQSDSRSARNASPSKLRSRSSVRKPEESQDASVSNTNRWSHSTSSSISTANNHHRRTSSFSKKRFSLGMSSLNTLGGRAQSPAKKTRATEDSSAIDNSSNTVASERAANLPSSQQNFSYSQPQPLARPLQTSRIPTTGAVGPGDSSRQPQPVSSRVQNWNQRVQQAASDATSPSSASTSANATITSPARRTPGHQANSGSQESTSSSGQVASPPRPRSRRDKDRDRDKKVMLTRALQRANDAVQLDHASNHDDAITAYQDACELLGQVLNRSTSEEDKRKLMTIRNTYTTRIAELQQIRDPNVEKGEGSNAAANSASHQEVRRSLQAMAKFEENVRPNTSDSANRPSTSGTTSTSTATPGSPESMTRGRPVSPGKGLQPAFQPSIATSSGSHIIKNRPPLVPPQPLKPRPLSPRQSPSRQTSNEGQDPIKPTRKGAESPKFHRRMQPSDADLGWLNSVEKEARSSQGSSHHSRSSETGLHRKHIRLHSDQTAAEFDAAFDAAVEAAYDDGYEPFIDSTDLTNTHEHSRQSSGDAAGPFARSQRFSKTAPAPLAMQRQPQADSSASGAHSSIPRQSDSSGFSGRTHGSSVGSGGTTAGTSFTNADNKSVRSPPTSMSPKVAHTQPLPPQHPPPNAGLPEPPFRLTNRSPSPGGMGPGGANTSVRDRRLDGQKAMKLKIETAATQAVEEAEPSDENPPTPLPKNSPPPPPPPAGAPAMPTRAAPGTTENSRLKPQLAHVPAGLTNISSPFPSPLPGMFNRTQSAENTSAGSPGASALNSAVSQDTSSFGPSPSSDTLVTPFSATSKSSLKKNASSLSLRSKSTLAPSIDEIEFSPATPLSLPFSATSATARKAHHFPGQPANTPVVGNFMHTPVATSQPMRMSGNTLFETDFHGSDRALSPSSARSDMPRPFEPCPNSQLLRPFWLMRLFHQTIVHPRGGYITTECFIPREVWEMKNVKLKGLEEKIASCDLLSAALLKLSTVNTLDADAVLSEMQALENVLDTAQANLSKKLGHDVGVQGVSSLFKDAPSNTGKTGEMGEGVRGADNDRTSGTKTSSKTYLSSWRKLRNKSSSNNLNSGLTGIRDGPKETLNMKSVPITSNLSVPSRHRGKDFVPVDPKGPNAGYAGAVAKLCDAAQVLDQVARQVEDPGLRHSSPTHVGLELSTRHAAEFFGFYICRFILQDVQMLVDKHVKRATEWIGA